MAKTIQERDADGFIKLKAIPGGKFDQQVHKAKTKKAKLPKNPDKMLDKFTDEYGMNAIADMTEVNIGEYVFDKGINYSLNTNVGRNIPWIEDGLKPVERRILYTMYMTKEYGGRFDKVATVSGNIVSRFHPHGDQALNDTIYRMGRTRSTMIPYIKSSGNYGNMYDMKPAAARYASASLSTYAMDCFFSEMGAKYPIFDVKDNYHYSEKEPIFLTSRYPNILMQWNLGIGKGAAAWLGAFNSRDLFGAALKMLDDPKAKIEIYPDTPIPVDITNKKDLKHCFDEKKFAVKMRAQYEIIADKKRDEHGKIVDKFTIVFTSLPLNVIGKVVVDEIVKIKEEDQKRPQAQRKLPEVINIEQSVTDKTPGGIHLIVEYEKGYDPNALAEKLFRSTSLGMTVGVRYVLIADNMPHEFTPREIMLKWIHQRYDQKRRYYHQLALKAAKDRAKLEASCILLESNNIDKAIKIIKKSETDSETVKALMKEFGFTEFQANIVIRLELRTLNRMNVEDLKKQRDQAVADYKHYRKLLSDETAIKDAIREELKEGQKKYGKDRMANVINLKTDAEAHDPEGIKRVYWNADNFMTCQSEQDRKALRGRFDKNYRVSEFQNSDKVIIFGRDGMIKLLDGYAFGANTSGIAFSQLGINQAINVIPMTKDLSEIVLVTSSGYGKRMLLDDVIKSTKSKIINLPEGDYIAGIAPVYSNKEGIVAMISGDKMYYSKLEDFPVLKRTATGNRIMKVNNGTLQKVFYLADPLTHILLYGDYGYAKVVDASMLTYNKRKPAAVTLTGKDISGVVPISKNHAPYMMYDELGDVPLTIEVDNWVHLSTVDGKDAHKFKLGNSISSSVKVFKKARNDYYQILASK